MVKSKGKPRIAQVASGDWHAYLGTRIAERFYMEASAREWLLDQLHPVNRWGEDVNPVTGEVAPAGQMWAKSMMGPWFLVGERVRYTATAASETYWSS